MCALPAVSWSAALQAQSPRPGPSEATRIKFRGDQPRPLRPPGLWHRRPSQCPIRRQPYLVCLLCPAASAAKKVCSGCCPVHSMQVRFSSGISFSSPQVVPGRRTQCLHAIAALGKSYIALCGVSCPACPLLQMASAIGRRHPSHCNVLKASCLLNAVDWSAGRRPALDAAAG